MNQSEAGVGLAPGTPLSEQPLVKEQWINAPVAAVYPFLIDRDRLERWLGSFADSPEQGSGFRLTIDDTHVAVGEFVLLQPNERVVFTFGWEDFEAVPEGSTTVTITLTEADEGTLVRLVHEGLPLGPEDEHAGGWLRCLNRLADEFESGSR